MIVTANPQNSHREYAIEFQDMQLAYTAESTVGLPGSNALFKPKLSQGAENKLTVLIPKYDGANQQAPAAFYISQTPDVTPAGVSGLIELLQGTKDGDPIPAPFQDQIFPNYGIPLGKSTVDQNTKVYGLADGDPMKGFLGAAMGVYRQPAADATGPVLNAGDYYILEATNPVTTEKTVNNVTLRATAPQSLSVYTPNISPGYADPPHAVNPNPGDAANLGTPRGPAQAATDHLEFQFRQRCTICVAGQHEGERHVYDELSQRAGAIASQVGQSRAD